MPAQPYHRKVAEAPRETIERGGGALSRTGFISQNASHMFAWIEGLSGEWPDDSHPYDQWMLVLEGALDFVLNGDDVYHLETGDIFYIPRDVPHHPVFTNDRPIRMFESFSPLRIDYLLTAEHQIAANAAPRDAHGSRRDDRASAASGVHPAYPSDPAYD